MIIQKSGLNPNGLDGEVLQYFSILILILHSLFCLQDFYLTLKLFNSTDAALIANWIDKKRGASYKLKDIPFKFILIYREVKKALKLTNFMNIVIIKDQQLL
jgi:hypothetical protein